jgi:preprotein translocase subunit YajC
MLATLLLFAQDAGGGGGAPAQPGAGAGGQPGFVGMLPFVGIAIIFLFLMMRSSRKQDREKQNMLASLDKNDKVLTIGGIYGTVVSVNPNEDEIVLKVDDNTRLKITKGSISKNITKEQAAAAPKADAGAQSTAVTTKPNG